MFGCSELEKADRERKSLVVFGAGLEAGRFFWKKFGFKANDFVELRCTGFSYSDVLVAKNLKTRWKKRTVFGNGIYLPKKKGRGGLLLLEYERVLKKGKVDKKLVKKAYFQGLLLHLFHELPKKKAKTRKRLAKKVVEGIGRI